MPCIICGSSDTVEAHLVPRGLVRRVAGKDQHALAGDTARAGYRRDGKGIFDPDLLCREHEDCFRLADDYGQRFLAAFHDKGVPVENGRFWSVPNRKPDLLVRFMASCVWRCAVSSVPKARPDLGPWERTLRTYLFGTSSAWFPLLLLGRQVLLIDGAPMTGPMLLLPFKATGMGRRTYSFKFGDCVMLLMLDQRRERRALERLGANQRDPALAYVLDEVDWQTQPDLVRMLGNMGPPPGT